MSSISLLMVSFVVLCAGALLSLCFMRHGRFAHLVSSASATLGSGAALAFGVYALAHQTVRTMLHNTSLPFVHLTLHVDPLASLFIIIVSAISLLGSIYGIAYMKQYYGAYNLGLFGFSYNIFILSLLLVVTAFNGLYFVFVWELMSLSSLSLVLFEYRKAATIKAGLLYFVMTHVATVFILVAFLMLYKATGSFDFIAIRASAAAITPPVRTVVAVCLLIGFGTKAGIIPFHIWLPKAHSAAPSHVSALMSGVMIKMGIFMFFRLFLDVLPQSIAWLGYVLLAIGAISSVLGVLFALAEHDSKRLLAYHSIENIGIILIGLGSGLIFLQLRQPALAALAIVASLFHTINHAVFKSLLFFGAGSVIMQTHTRNIERYGGLIKRMPLTALCFLVGAVAISGLPPFNGFASEWLTFQGIFSGILSASLANQAIFIAAGGALAVTGGLAAACFVKAFGITFLARPRTAASEAARESSWLMTTTMGLLAIITLALGLSASVVVRWLQRVAYSMPAFQTPLAPVLHTSSHGTLHTLQSGGTLNMLIVLFGFLCALAITCGFVWLISHRQKVTYNILWACGYHQPLTPRMEITATGFARTLIIVYKRLFRPSRQLETEPVGLGLQYFPRSSTVTLDITDIFDVLYSRVHPCIDRFSQQAKKVQSGNLNQYLLYIFVVLVGLMIWIHFQ